MTPDIIEYYKVNNRSIYIELSTGEGFKETKLFGVTFSNGDELLHEYNKSFSNLTDAKDYIDQMIIKLK